ncbi:hypothetical protein SNE40_009461 [Patella caerulea]|uniref:ER-bound oxygenase mpaB/mpaB'/Rubber oxygenase catalytic domain-containing protein n=1 Tax=Patella caerulea TaxID=87958 RepID=A0AAN8JZ32_PATCE
MYLEKLAEGKTEIGESGLPPRPPENFDMTKFDRGRKFIQDHVICHVLAMFISLVCGMSVVNLLEPLIFTNNSDTPNKAYRRYISTFMHVTKWYYGNIWEENNKAQTSILTVRNMHNKVRKDMTAHEAKIKNSESVDIDSLNHERIASCPMAMKDVRLSQYDMSLVQTGFLGIVVMYPRFVGIDCTEAELDDFVYFWYGVGYMLGITDKNNICKEGFHITRDICKEIEQQILIPSLENPPSQFYPMAKAFIDGGNIAHKNKLNSVESVLAIGYHGMNVKLPKLSFMDYCRYLFLRGFVIVIYYCPPVKKLFNKIIRHFFWDSSVLEKKMN